MMQRANIYYPISITTDQALQVLTVVFLTVDTTVKAFTVDTTVKALTVDTTVKALAAGLAIQIHCGCSSLDCNCGYKVQAITVVTVVQTLALAFWTVTGVTDAHTVVTVSTKSTVTITVLSSV